MAFTVPVASFLAAQLPGACIGDVQRFEKVVKVFGVGNLKNEFLQSLGVLKCIIDGFIESLDMEEAFEVFHILHKEIKEILAVGSVPEQQGEFIRFLILSFYSPEMVESVDYSCKPHTL